MYSAGESNVLKFTLFSHVCIVGSTHLEILRVEFKCRSLRKMLTSKIFTWKERATILSNLYCTYLSKVLT